MNKKKTNTTSTQNQNYTYGWQTPPVNAQMQAVIDSSQGPAKVDPSIQQRFATAKEDVVRSYADPFGADTSADVRAKAQRSQLFTIDRERDKSMREGYFDAENAKFGRQVAAAGLTSPQLVTTGGSGSGTSNTTQSGGFWAATLPALVQGGASAAG